MTRQSPPLSAAPAWTLCVLFAIAAPNWAAPATSEELRADEGLASVTAGLPGSRSSAIVLPATTGVPQSKTVELLLQLQDRPQTLEGSEKTSGSAAARRTVTAGPATSPGGTASTRHEEPNPLAQLKSAILAGPSMSQPGAANVRAPAEPGVDRASSLAGAPMRMGNLAAGYREPGDSLLAHPVVRFIRENRVLTVVGSLAVLAGIWLTANHSFHRRR